MRGLIKGREGNTRPEPAQLPPLGLLGWEEGAFSSSESQEGLCRGHRGLGGRMRPAMHTPQGTSPPSSPPGFPWEEASQKQTSKPRMLFMQLTLPSLEKAPERSAGESKDTEHKQTRNHQRCFVCLFVLLFPNIKRDLLFCKVKQRFPALFLFLANSVFFPPPSHNSVWAFLCRLPNGRADPSGSSNVLLGRGRC